MTPQPEGKDFPPSSQPRSELRGTRASLHLDMIRGLAAVAVLYMHARVLLVQSAGDEPRSFLIRLFYSLSRYGHVAVIVFFVLSGYLIAGSVVRAIATDRWSWKTYLMARGTRLYVVLVPTLLLTAFWDQSTVAVIGTSHGNTDIAHAIIDSETMCEHANVETFVGNLAFLQTILVPSYGSNTALWSLANEFWYYLIFPCLWLALRGRESFPRRCIYACVGISLAIFVGPAIVLYFPAWLLGALLTLVPLSRSTVARSNWAIVAASLPLLIMLGLVGRNWIPFGYTSNYGVALALVPFLYVILQRREAAGRSFYARLATLLAGCSYTLYATHLPLLIFLRACFTYERPWPSDVRHWVLVGLCCLAAFVYALALAQITEAQTERVRRWLSERIAPTRIVSKLAESPRLDQGGEQIVARSAADLPSRLAPVRP